MVNIGMFNAWLNVRFTCLHIFLLQHCQEHSQQDPDLQRNCQDTLYFLSEGIL